MEETIQIDWNGPVMPSDMLKLNKKEDRGLYQIYLFHPLYGDCLAYIGKTDASFARRPLNHGFEKGSDSDRNNIRYYVGRLIGVSTPDMVDWRNQIRLAEMLLIHAHAPAYNSTNIDRVAQPKMTENVRVLNWGDCRSLQREVSGLMWSRKRDPDLLPFGTHNDPPV